jgi:hypothetical protein
MLVATTLSLQRWLLILLQFLINSCHNQRAYGESTVYLHNKLGKQKTNFSVDQLSQALELTSSDETSLEEQKILMGIVTFGNTDTKQ